MKKKTRNKKKCEEDLKKSENRIEEFEEKSEGRIVQERRKEAKVGS